MNPVEGENDRLMMSTPVGNPARIPDPREPYEKKRAVNFILLSTFLERIAFNAFTISLFAILLLNEAFDWTDQNGKTASYIFVGISQVSTVLFAVISDWKLGRGKIIIAGFILDLIGLIIMTITSTGTTFLCHFGTKQQRVASSIFEEKCAPTVLSTLVLTALGAGAIKSNLVIFGAEQNQDQESRLTSRYFEKYVLVANVGGALAILIVPYVQAVLPHNEYYILYIVVIVIFLLAGVLFRIGWRYYLHVPIGDSVIFYLKPVLSSACRSWYALKKHQRTKNHRRQAEGHAAATPMRKLNNFTVEDEQDETFAIREKLPSVLDFARSQYGGACLDRHVNEVKALRSAVIVFMLLLPFWLIENQTNSTFQSQAEYMNRPVSKPYVITWMTLGDPVIVSIGIVILNLWVYRYYPGQHKSSRIMKKFIVGMCFAAASMLVAGTVEIFRQKKCIPGSTYSTLSIYVQLVQSILIGFSQLFGTVAGYEYAYFAAPRSSQSFFMSLYFSSAGLSFLIGIIYFNFFPTPDVYISFKCENDTQWYWSYFTYFYIMCAVQVMVMIIFILCHRKYKLVELNRQQLEPRARRKSSSEAF